MVAVFPFDGKGISANRLGALQPGGRGNRIRAGEYSRIGIPTHFVMASPAFGARAGISQQREGIGADMPIRPLDGQQPGLPVRTNSGWTY